MLVFIYIVLIPVQLVYVMLPSLANFKWAARIIPVIHLSTGSHQSDWHSQDQRGLYTGQSTQGSNNSGTASTPEHYTTLRDPQGTQWAV